MAERESSKQERAFSRRFQLDQISSGGLNDSFEASAEELAAMAELLGLESLGSLGFAFELKPAGVRRFVVRGRLRAHLNQICVVSLEPFETDIDRPISVEFVAEKEWQRLQEGAEDQLADPAAVDLEPIEGDAIDLGQFAYECLATEIEPYPRKPGIDFEWKPAGGPASEEDIGPFSALKVLKEK